MEASEFGLNTGALEKTEDPVRIYLREMGIVPLLTREEEVDIAKRIERGQLRTLKAPTLIAWATDDVFFSVKWARWLADTIPGAKPPVLFEGARIFFPEERADPFNAVFRKHVSDS